MAHPSLKHSTTERSDITFDIFTSAVTTLAPTASSSVRTSTRANLCLRRSMATRSVGPSEYIPYFGRNTSPSKNAWDAPLTLRLPDHTLLFPSTSPKLHIFSPSQHRSSRRRIFSRDEQLHYRSDPQTSPDFTPMSMPHDLEPRNASKRTTPEQFTIMTSRPEIWSSSETPNTRSPSIGRCGLDI